jgi:hypothetical protein
MNEKRLSCCSNEVRQKEGGRITIYLLMRVIQLYRHAELLPWEEIRSSSVQERESLKRVGSIGGQKEQTSGSHRKRHIMDILGGGG